MIASGSRALSQAPTAVPSALPVPAATATSPSEAAGPRPPSGCSRSRNARKNVRKPDSARSAALAWSPCSTDGPTVRSPGLGGVPPETAAASRAASRARPSPLAESTLCGNENDRNVPVANTTNAPYSGQLGPIRCSPPPAGAATPVASSPASVTRELALTSEICGGSSRGTTALRTTPYALEATSTPSATGYSWSPPVATASAIVSASSARASIAPAIAARRPCGTRSSSGPTTGASSANGAMVTARYSATRPRAWSVGTEKNTVEASAIVIIMSPAEFTACSSISLLSPDSPAPCACVTRCRPRPAAVNGTRSARPATRPARRARSPSYRAAATWPYCPNSPGRLRFLGPGARGAPGLSGRRSHLPLPRGVVHR